MAADPKTIIRRLDAQRGERQPHEQAWKEICDYTFPERGHGLNGSVVTPQDAQSKQIRILDDTAADSSRILAANIVTGTTPANSIWLGLDFGPDIDNIGKNWADEAARFIFENIHASNFDSAAYECALDMTGPGWFVLYIDEKEGGGYHFEQWPLGQCYVSSSKSGGLIDTIYREFEMTVEQVVNAYGIDKVSERVRSLYQSEKFDDKIKLCHAIYPRKLSVVGGKRAINLPFASCHVEIDSKTLLKEGGYHEFPCIVPRWQVIPGTAYAKGPGCNALGSIRTLNDIKALELAALDVAVGGMWLAVDDGVLNPRTIKLGPRKVIIANDLNSMKELRSGSDFNVGFSAEDRLQAQIRKVMLADQLQPQDGPAMTATEVHVRVQLIRQLLGPIYGRLQAEYLQQMVERCFGIAYRAGVLGQAPKSLRERTYTVRYMSPFARAQRLEDVTAMDRLEETLIQEAQAAPEILDLYDFEEALRLRREYLGAPTKVLRDKDAVEVKRNARAAQQKQQQATAMQQDIVTQSAPDLIKRAVA